jgi:GT2 family glycosyltransferase
VSVAVVSWNGRAHLARCLEALAAQTDPGVPWEVLVLDNGSTDGTADWLGRAHPRVRLVRSPVNLGFCAGNNRLIAEATGDAVALLNNDTLPEPGWLAALVDSLAAAPADVAAVSGRIVDWPGERLDFARGVMTFDGHAFQPGFRRRLDSPGAEGLVPADGSELFFACGGNMLVRRASYLAAGGFDPDYFAYLEDVDLGWRLWAGGERVLFARDAVVHHRSMATSDLLGLFNRGFLFERNAFLTAYKNYQDGLWQRVLPAILWTLIARTQTLLVRDNPGGDELTRDPYAGLVAGTAAPEGAPASGESAGRPNENAGQPAWGLVGNAALDKERRPGGVEAGSGAGSPPGVAGSRTLRKTAPEPSRNSPPYSCRKTRSGSRPRSASMSAASRWGFAHDGAFQLAWSGSPR